MSPAKKRGPGRPRLDAEKAKGSLLSIRLTPKEREKIDAAARMSGGSPSAWAREVLLAAAPKLDHVRNRIMKERLMRGEALDVSRCARTPEGDYLLDGLLRKKALADARSNRGGHEWCDVVERVWIQSIGVREDPEGHVEVVASTSSKFYERPGWKCIWLA